MSAHEALATGEFSVVRLPDEVDLANRSEVLTGLLTTIAHGGSHLVVDARDVRFMDSSGLGALLRACERTAVLGGSFHLVAAGRRMRRLIELTGLDRVLRRVDTMEDAVACITSASDHHVCGAAHVRRPLPLQH